MKRIPTGLVAAVAVLATGVADLGVHRHPDRRDRQQRHHLGVVAQRRARRPQPRRRPGSASCRSTFPQSLDLAGRGCRRHRHLPDELRLDRPRQLGLQPPGRPVRGGPRRHPSPPDLTAAQSNYATILDGAIKRADPAGRRRRRDRELRRRGRRHALHRQEAARRPAGRRAVHRAVQPGGRAVPPGPRRRPSRTPPSSTTTWPTPPQFIQDCVSASSRPPTRRRPTPSTTGSRRAPRSPAATAAATANPAASARSGQVGCTSPRPGAVAAAADLGDRRPTRSRPLQSNGTWAVFLVTSRTPVLPVTQAAPSIRQVLMRTTANRNRVSAEVLALRPHVRGRRSTRSTAPGPGPGSCRRPRPPPRYLLPIYGSTVDAASRPRGRPTGTRPPVDVRPTGSSRRPTTGAEHRWPAARIDVVGPGAGRPRADHRRDTALLASASQVFLRTARHPAADAVVGARHLRPPLRVGRHLRRRLPDDRGRPGGRRGRWAPWPMRSRARRPWPSAPWCCSPSTPGSRRARSSWSSTRRSRSWTSPSPASGWIRWTPGCAWSTPSGSPSTPQGNGARCWWPSAGAARCSPT